MVEINNEGAYTFTLSATDTKGNTVSDTVKVLVEKITVDPDPTGKVKLIAFGDNDSTPDAEKVLTAIMREPNVNQYMHIGDGPYNKSGVKWVTMMKKYFDDVKVKMLMISRGNHDTKSSKSIQTQRDIES